MMAVLAGRVSRRELMRRAAALGLSGPALAALLAACGSGGSTTSTATATTGTSDAGGATASAGASGTAAASPSAGGIASIPPVPEAKGALVIAYQPGIGYAQLLIAKQNKWVEQVLPNMQVSYKLLSSGAAIRDGMLAGQIQVGSGGVGPFLVGWDKGVAWKLLSALNQMDLWLMVKDARIQNLKDFTSNDKIALPAPDSIQAVVLRKGAQQQLGDARALDKNMVAMSHPDGLQALLSGQIAGHLTSPPFQFQEQEQGARAILKSFDLFGSSTFNSVFVRDEYYSKNQSAMQALFDIIKAGTDLIQKDSDQAAEILSAEAGGQTSKANFKTWMTANGVSYTVVPHGFVDYAKFMKEIGLIDKVPGSWEDLVFDTLKGTQGS